MTKVLFIKTIIIFSTLFQRICLLDVQIVLLKKKKGRPSFFQSYIEYIGYVKVSKDYPWTEIVRFKRLHGNCTVQDQ